MIAQNTCFAKSNKLFLLWTDTKGKNRDCVHCVFGVLETNQNFYQRLLLQQLDWSLLDGLLISATSPALAALQRSASSPPSGPGSSTINFGRRRIFPLVVLTLAWRMMAPSLPAMGSMTRPNVQRPRGVLSSTINAMSPKLNGLVG